MAASKSLSELQQGVLEYIRRYWRENQRPPTIREIQEAQGISSTSVVNYNLNALARAGYISRTKEVSRGIQIVDESRPRLAEDVLLRLPLGVIRAGEPILVPDFQRHAEESDVGDYVELTRDLVKDEHHVFALRVEGESMIDALVNDGDVVLMRAVPPDVITEGDMVAAWLDEEQETTLKRFYHKKGDSMVRLQPANPTMNPIFVRASNVRIQGKVIAIIRKVA